MGILTVGGFTGQNIRVASRYATVAEAISDTPAGGRLYFPAEDGPYTPPTAAGWTLSRPITIFSDGMSSGSDVGFIPYGSDKNSVVFVIDSAAVRDIRFHDCVFSSTDTTPDASGTGDHVRFTGATTISNVVFERCWFNYAGRSGIYFDGSAASVYVAGLSMRDCRFYSNGGHGAYLERPTSLVVDNCWFQSNQGMGLAIVDCTSGLSINGGAFESNGGRLAGTATATLPAVFGLDYNAQLYLENCSSGSIRGVNIENAASANPTFSLNSLTLAACEGIVVGGCHIHNVAAVASTIGIKLINGTVNCAVLPNKHELIDITVSVHAVATEFGNLICPQNAVGNATAPGRVVMNAAGQRNFVFVTDRTQADGIANNKGVGILLPNMATASATVSTTDAGDTITAAAFEGLMAYSSANNTVYVLTAANTWTPLA